MGKVSVITPSRRPDFLPKLIQRFESQDYADKELLIMSDGIGYGEQANIRHWGVEGYTLGDKRNALCQYATGDIILHMDDDDLYAPDWISKSVAALTSDRWDIVGLSNAYFYKVDDKQTFEMKLKPTAQLYLCGATLCYWRKTWARKMYKSVTRGEDTQFLTNIGYMHCHGYKEGFTAMVHGNNTVCHESLPLMRKVDFTPRLVLMEG